jgi:hypothetical protein
LADLVLSFIAMMSTVVIPTEVLDLVRDGLRSQVALAAQDVASADEELDAGRYPERYQDPLRCFDASRALLEKIGWSTPPSDLKLDPPAHLKVDLDTHGWALLEALQDQLSDHADKLRDIPGDDEWDKEHRDIVTRDMNALMSLAMIVVLRLQADKGLLISQLR